MSRTLRPLPTFAAIAMVALISACGSNAPAATGSGSNTAANVEQAVKFSQCMRANGVGNFPDPDASGALTIDGVINGSSLDPYSSTFPKVISASERLRG